MTSVDGSKLRLGVVWHQGQVRSHQLKALCMPGGADGARLTEFRTNPKRRRNGQGRPLLWPWRHEAKLADFPRRLGISGFEDPVVAERYVTLSTGRKVA